MKYFLGVLFVFVSVVCHASDLYPFHTLRHQNQFARLLREFRCVVCQNEDLASSNAKIAVDLRHQVYQLVKRNHSNRYIQHFLTTRYGDSILLKPSFVQSTLFLWLFPFVMVAAGVWVYFRTLRKSGRRKCTVLQRSIKLSA